MYSGDLSKICALIPAYNPDVTLSALVGQLVLNGLSRIIIVNDGSSHACDPIFDQLKTLSSVTLLTHADNQGKGAALKTGFAYIETHFTDIIGAVTADADGQHLAHDIKKVAAALSENETQLILGARDFHKNIPFRSKLGNCLTRKLLLLFYRIRVKDSQTGLRGIPYFLLKTLSKIQTKHYEFEFECLIQASKLVSIREVPIDTVYENGNISSHFKPIIDSVKIYFVFIKYSIVAILSYGVDIGAFSTLLAVKMNLLYSLVLARIFSAIFNFICNKFIVYQSKNSKSAWRESVGYIILVALNIILSYGIIVFENKYLKIPNIPSKILADSLLFFFSFYIQKKIIFKNHKKDPS